MKQELYQVATTGRIKHLVIWTEENILCRQWWTSKNGVDGKRQETRDTILGKNAGKANETSDVEQCELDYGRKLQKKMDEGYVTSLEEAKTKAGGELDISQKLALEFAPSKPISKLPAAAEPFDGSWLAERKYDGVCVLLHNTGTESIVYSRRMLPITEVTACITDLQNKLAMVPSESLFIGELLAFDKNGKESTKVLRGITSDKTSPEKAAVRYAELVADGWTIEFQPYEVYFDTGEDVTNLAFHHRNQIVENVFGISRNIKRFTTEMVQEAKDNGWEGYILRQAGDTVTFTTNGKAKRKGGYKYKFLETADCIITEVTPGNGKHQTRFARFKLNQYENGILISCGWAGGGQLGEKRMDEITAELVAKGYKVEPTVLDAADHFAVELEYQSRQPRNEKGELCFEFPIILQTREDKPLIECEV